MLMITLSLTAAFAYSLYALGSHRLVRVVSWVTLALVMFVAGVALFLVPALLVDGLPTGAGQLRDAGLAALGGLLYAAATPCFLLALRVGRLSLVTVLACLDGAFAAVISIALGERVGAMAIVGLVCAATGGLLAAVERRSDDVKGGASRRPGWRLAAGAGLAVLTSLIMAGLFICYGAIDGFSAFTTVTIGSVAGLAVMLPVAVVRHAVTPPREQAIGVAGVSVLDALALLAGSAGLALGPVSIAAVLQAQTATLSTLLGLAVLHERPAWWQAAGIATTIVGVSLLAWSM